MKSRLEKEVRFLKAYAVGSSVLLLVLTVGAFSYTQSERFEEVTAERINIVEPDGTQRLVLSNTERMPGLVIGGDTVQTRESAAGMLFYNERGGESGGLTYSSLEGVDAETGEPRYRASGHLAFDQYRQDQTVMLTYQDDGERQKSGLRVVDRPDDLTFEDMKAMREEMAQATGEEKARLQRQMQEDMRRGRFGAERVFAGSNRDRQATVSLRDAQNNERLRMRVDSAGTAYIEFLNESGEVVRQISQGAE